MYSAIYRKKFTVLSKDDVSYDFPSECTILYAVQLYLENSL
jgi:hypothetical protein